jgi:hypothetical protein
VKLYVLLPQLMVIDACFFQGMSSLHTNNVLEAIHIRQIHENVALDKVESEIMFFAIQMLVNCDIVPQLMVINACFFPRTVIIKS